MLKFSITDICTGKQYPATLVRETKCYYTVTAATVCGKDNEVSHRFHKSTLFIEWQHLALRVIEA